MDDAVYLDSAGRGHDDLGLGVVDGEAATLGDAVTVGTAVDVGVALAQTMGSNGFPLKKLMRSMSQFCR